MHTNFGADQINRNREILYQKCHKHHHHPSLSPRHLLTYFRPFLAKFEVPQKSNQVEFRHAVCCSVEISRRKIDNSKNVLENVKHNQVTGSQKVAISDNSASVYISSHRRCGLFFKRGGDRYRGCWIWRSNLDT